MLDEFIFEDHFGRRFVGLDNGVYLNYSDLRDYTWSFDTINSRISRFYRSVTDRKIPLVIACNSPEEAISVKHRLLELAETDIEALLPGKIYIGEYYTRGYITSSTKSEYLIDKRVCKMDLILTSDDPMWYREKKHTFLPGSAESIATGADYAYDYPYDYGTNYTGSTIHCDSMRGNAFRLTIYGSTLNPSITIGGHVYALNGSIGAGESVLIDSLTKTITLTKADGEKVNWFDNRDRESYIFQEIPPGQHTIIWDESFGFDLTVIEKRSEPKWI